MNYTSRIITLLLPSDINYVQPEPCDGDPLLCTVGLNRIVKSPAPFKEAGRQTLPEAGINKPGLPVKPGKEMLLSKGRLENFFSSPAVCSP